MMSSKGGDHSSNVIVTADNGLVVTWRDAAKSKGNLLDELEEPRVGLVVKWREAAEQNVENDACRVELYISRRIGWL